MGIDGTYKIEVDTPLGLQSGTAKLSVSGSVVKAHLESHLFGKLDASGTASGNSFEFSGRVRIVLKVINYRVKGTVEGDVLRATVSTDGGSTEVEGKRIR